MFELGEGRSLLTTLPTIRHGVSTQLRVSSARVKARHSTQVNSIPAIAKNNPIPTNHQRPWADPLRTGFAADNDESDMAKASFLGD
jgi:hypothetical protein